MNISNNVEYTGKCMLHASIIKESNSYRDTPVVLYRNGINILLFASNNRITYTTDNISHIVDVIGHVTWKGDEYKITDEDIAFITNIVYDELQNILNYMAKTGIDYTTISNHTLRICSYLNNTPGLIENISNKYGHTAIVCIQLLSIPELYDKECEYCNVFYSGEKCPRYMTN